MPKLKIYIMYGLGGRMWSAGMEDNLAKKLRALSKDIDVPPTYGWGSYDAITADINGKVALGTKVAVIGHSMGGNAATWIANSARRAINLLVAYDPTVWSSVQPIPSRVKTAIGIHGNDFWSFVGKAYLAKASGNTTTKLTTIETSDPHVAIDDDNALHAKTIAAVKELLI